MESGVPLGPGKFYVVVLVNIISETLKALQPSSCDLETAKYGKVPRSVAIANNVSQYWETIKTICANFASLGGNNVLTDFKNDSVAVAPHMSKTVDYNCLSLS